MICLFLLSYIQAQIVNPFSELIFVSISVLFNLDKKTDNVDENVYVIEQDYSNFFTVNSCINKYIQFLTLCSES